MKHINLFICLINCYQLLVATNPDKQVLDLENKDDDLKYRKTFHFVTSYKSGGRVNFKPWISIEEKNSRSSDLAITPNFEDGSYVINLVSNDENMKKNCLLEFSCLNHWTGNVVPTKNLTSENCTWSNIRLKPGSWYNYKVWKLPDDSAPNKTLIVHFWQPVEPAFDPDEFGIVVVPNDTSVEVRVDSNKTSATWNYLIGDAGEILVSLIGHKKLTTTITSRATKVSNPIVKIENLIPGRCYIVETMTTVENILSFNRTWFNVRTSAPRIALLLDDPTSNSVSVRIILQNEHFYQDSSCQTILTVGEKRNDGSHPRYIFLGDQLETALKDLEPSTEYILGGVSQCGSLGDNCRLQKTPIAQTSFTTKDKASSISIPPLHVIDG